MLPLAPPDPAHLDPLLLLLAALALDAVAGDPAILFRRLPHPVALIGGLIGFLEQRLNRPELGDVARWRLGVAMVIAVLALAAAMGLLLGRLAASLPWGGVITIVAVAVLVAQRSLYDHVASVARALETGGLAAGRAAIRHIVGRDPESLDEAGIARAAIESVAENFSDGVAAPVFWFLVLGLPGLCVYKAANTLDSMIGHRSPRYREFGWAAARLDDGLNLVPARLAGLLIVFAACVVRGAGGRMALVTMMRDAEKHRSPNAGWPEAAMAGALGLGLAGPRRYGAEIVNDPWLGQGRIEADAADISRALGIYVGACAIEAALIAGLAALRAFS